jgi:hypothetical protein
MRRFFPLLVALLACPAAFAQEAKPLIVHEWGTFTSLQDETGRSIGYLNSSAEPLPDFVHNLRSGMILGGKRPNYLSKGIDMGAHPDITMRLETPVIYFHPEDATPFKLDVSATFNGGVLSEFYPYARFHIEGGYPAPAGLDAFTPALHGSLTWKSLRVGGDVKIPATPEHVWLAPRKVNSAPVAIGDEGERYVFYRGVGNVPAPLTFTRDEAGNLHAQPPDATLTNAHWLAEFRADGTCAYTRLTDQRQADRASRAPTFPGRFADADFSADNAKQLRGELRQGLIRDGLFEDEADAMLNTWERSYFQGVGQRVFFLVPRAWTDRVLPLKFSMPVNLTRVMIGRIELITPQQHELLAQLPASKDAKALEQLGRFGYAMVLDQLKQHPNATLKKYADAHGIRAFTPPPATQPVVLAD